MSANCVFKREMLKFVKIRAHHFHRKLLNSHYWIEMWKWEHGWQYEKPIKAEKKLSWTFPPIIQYDVLWDKTFMCIHINCSYMTECLKTLSRSIIIYLNINWKTMARIILYTWMKYIVCNITYCRKLYWKYNQLSNLNKHKIEI